MAKVEAKPVLFKAPISVGADEYTAHLNQAQFEPTQPTAAWTDLDGKTTNFGGDSAWQFICAGAQDWETVNSMTQYMLAHEGETVEVTVGLPGGGQAVGQVVMAAPTIGGTINSPLLFNKTLPCQGAPVFTPGV